MDLNNVIRGWDTLDIETRSAVVQELELRKTRDDTVIEFFEDNNFVIDLNDLVCLKVRGKFLLESLERLSIDYNVTINIVAKE